MSFLGDNDYPINPSGIDSEKSVYGLVRRDLRIDGALTSTVDIGPWCHSYNRDYFVGKEIPDFHRRRNSGELLPHTTYLNLSNYVWACSSPYPLSAGFTSGGQVYRYTWQWKDLGVAGLPSSTVFPSVLDPNAVTVMEGLGFSLDPVLQALASKIYSRGWDGLTFFAEFHQVLRMFKEVLPRVISILGKAFRMFRSGHLRQLGFESIDAYLQTRYGWRILMYDIEDINNLISHAKEKRRTRVKERGGGDITHVDDNSYTVSGGHTLSVSDVTTYEIMGRCSIIADFTPSRIQINPVVTAWEIVPYSFVLDWFLNIGSALEALSFLYLNNKYTSSVGARIDVTREVSIIPSAGLPVWQSGFYSNFGDISVNESWVLKGRVPRSVQYLPYWGVDLSPFKVLDLIALMFQRLK